MGDLDPGIRALLDGPLAWYELAHLEVCTSTNDVAAERVRGGAPPGLVVVADHQSAGRGRMSRPWEDGRGRSLLCSMTVPLPPRDASLVPLVAGVAAADAAHRAGARVRLKWPNDLVATRPDGSYAKAGGILVERHDADPQAQLVVGVGINLDWREVPREGESVGWTSLAEEGAVDIERWALLADLLRGVDAWVRDLLRGTHRAVEAYTAKCDTLGRDVAVTTPDGAVLTGRATQIARDGALVVATADGLKAVQAGDVHHVRPT